MRHVVCGAVLPPLLLPQTAYDLGRVLLPTRQAAAPPEGAGPAWPAASPTKVVAPAGLKLPKD